MNVSAKQCGSAVKIFEIFGEVDDERGYERRSKEREEEENEEDVYVRYSSGGEAAVAIRTEYLVSPTERVPCSEFLG